MRALITGCNGFLGTNLVKFIQENHLDWEIFGLDITENSNEKITFYNRDLSCAVNWKEILLKIEPDVIFHLAGVFHIKNNEIMFKINTSQSLSIIDCINAIEINPILVLIGSAAEYGIVNPSDNPLPESITLSPTSFHGLTKKWQEEIALHYHKTYGTPVICTRPSNFIGKGIASTLLPGYLTERFSISKNQIDINITSDQDRRDYIDVRDASEVLVGLISTNKTIGEVFNISKGKSTSNLDLINHFAQISKKEVAINYLNKDNFFDISLSNDKIKEFINWEPKYTLYESVEWCLSNLIK